jgi:hypothetical protein
MGCRVCERTLRRVPVVGLKVVIVRVDMHHLGIEKVEIGIWFLLFRLLNQA